MGSTTSNDEQSKNDDQEIQKPNPGKQQEKILTNKNIRMEELNDVVKKQVLIVGSTGTGKSTVINMLYNNDVNSGSCKAPAPVGDTSDSITKGLHYYYDGNRQISLIDTIGLSDPKITDIEVVSKMKEFLSLSDSGINLIIVVVKWGRISGPERFNLEAISNMFNKGWKNNAVLVLTHYKYEFSENHKAEDEQVQLWKEKDSETIDFVSGFGKVIVTENAIDRPDDIVRFENFRKRLLKELNDSIDTSSKTIRISPASWEEKIYAVLSLFYLKFKRQARKMKDIMAAIKSQGFETYAGFCPICQESIKLPELTRSNCKHSFCFTCINTWSSTSKICPVCKQTITHIYINK